MASAKATTDHDQIRKWVESRGGFPAHVKRTGRKNDPGVLRIDYPGYSGKESLERVSWDEWFRWFDRNKLAFLFQEGRSRFSKLVDRATVKLGRNSASKKKAGTSTRSASSKRASSKKAASKKSSSKKASSKKSSATKSSAKRTTAKKSTFGRTTAKKSTAASRKRTTSKKSTASKKRATSSKKATSTKKATSRKSSSSSRRTSRAAIRTTDHNEIRRWVEARGGFPAHVKRTSSRKDPGVLRIDYPGYTGRQSLERISWDEWFDGFEENKLAFLYQDKANSRFSKLVAR